MSNDTAMQPHVPQEALQFLQMSRRPAEVLKDAVEAAKAIKEIVDKKANPVIFNNQRYLEVDDWATVGRFYALSAEVEWTRFVDYGGAQGFEARVRIIHVATGQQVSAAEGMCLNDEERWSARPKYDQFYVLKDGSKQVAEPPRDQMVWIPNPKKPGSNMPKKERILNGEVKVPLAQIRSMAQTRATSKAYRTVVGWVAVLAGYQPTPAEELTGREKEFVDAETGELHEQQGAAQTSPERKSTGNGHATKARPDGAQVATGKIKGPIEEKAGTTNGNPWIRHTIKLVEGGAFKMFKQPELLVRAREAMEAALPVEIVFTVGSYGNDIFDLTVIEPAKREAGAEG